METYTLLEIDSYIITCCRNDKVSVGWSGGAMVLGKLPVPGRPTNLDNSRARAYSACIRCGWGCLVIFLSFIISLLSLSLSLSGRLPDIDCNTVPKGR